MVLSRILDILWAFPVYLLAISLSIVLISKGITIGPLEINANSLLLPIGIIRIIYVPYVARPVRGPGAGLKKANSCSPRSVSASPPGGSCSRTFLPMSRPC